jgi:hypothetical protein
MFLFRCGLVNYEGLVALLDGIYMTSGSSLELVGLPRSIGGFHYVWAYFGVFQAPSLYSLVPPWQ